MMISRRENNKEYSQARRRLCLSPLQGCQGTDVAWKVNFDIIVGIIFIPGILFISGIVIIVGIIFIVSNVIIVGIVVIVVVIIIDVLIIIIDILSIVFIIIILCYRHNFHFHCFVHHHHHHHPHHRQDHHQHHHQACGLKGCPSEVIGWRDEQCALHNNRALDGK